MYVSGMGRYRGLGKVSADEVLVDVMLFGMGRYRGLGQTPLNCPGDIGCPGNTPSMIQTPLTPAQIAALSASNAAYFNQPCDPGINPNCGGTVQTLTQWLNANATTVMIGAGVLLALAALR